MSLGHVSLELVSVLVIAFALWRATADQLRSARPFALAVVSFGVLLAAQLLPLPPAFWARLPGHGFYAAALDPVVGANQWRPWSLTPDLTLQGLLALLPLMAAAMLFAPLDGRARRLVLDVLIGCVAIAAAVFVVMLGSGATTIYDVANQGGGGGLFANRNHLALFLAVGLMLLPARWRMAKREDPVALGVLAGAVLLILVALLVLGSRAGLIAGAIALVLSAAVFVRKLFAGGSAARRVAIVGAGIAMLAAVAAIALFSTRQQSLDRLAGTGATLTTSELRVANFPAVLDTIRAFFPTGAGFGSFDAVFRRFESDALLRPSYFNHAHNDLAEIVIEGGVPALLLVGVVLVWLVRRMPILWRTSASSAAPAQAGVIGIILLLLGSLADYPLRTPFLGVVFVLLATWAGGPDERDGAGLGTGDGLR